MNLFIELLMVVALLYLLAAIVGQEKRFWAIVKEVIGFILDLCFSVLETVLKTLRKLHHVAWQKNPVATAIVESFLLLFLALFFRFVIFS